MVNLHKYKVDSFSEEVFCEVSWDIQRMVNLLFQESYEIFKKIEVFDLNLKFLSLLNKFRKTLQLSLKYQNSSSKLFSV